MNLDQIHYFLAIVETGSFTQAADKLLLAQPSLSSAIKKLERELGVTLFTRGGRGTKLTPAGAVFLEKAQQILRDYEQAIHELRNFHPQPTLRLGILASLSIVSLSKLMGSFRQQHPDISVEIRTSHVDDLSRWLTEKEIDVALTILEPTDQTQSSCKLFHQPLRLAVPNHHPFAKRTQVNLKDLDNQPYIQRINCEFWRANPKMYEDSDVYPNFIYKADCEEWVISLVQSGYGVSVMPEWSDISGITYVELEGVKLERTVGVKWHSKENLHVVRLFENFVREFVRQENNIEQSFAIPT